MKPASTREISPQDAAPPPTRSMFGRRSLWQWAGIAVSIALMVYILVKMDVTEFLSLVSRLPLWALAGVIAVYVLLNFFRTLRFRIFMPRPHPSVVELIPIVLYHNFLTRVLPFKTGEISYVVLLNRYLKQPLSEGISSLLSARLFELALVILGGAFGALSIATQPANQRWTTFGVMIAFLVLYMIALYFSGSILRFVARAWTRLIAPRLVTRFPRLENRVEAKLHLFAGQFDRIHDPRRLLSACVLSACTYSMSMSFDLILLRGLGIDNPLGVLVAIVSIKMFIEAAPIAVSGFGAIEGAWALGLVTLAGLDETTAATVALFLHLAQVVVAALVGLAGWLILSRLKAPGPAAPEAPIAQ